MIRLTQTSIEVFQGDGRGLSSRKSERVLPDSPPQWGTHCY